jgi:1-acyl-sn-glycerol-3-phosphate acyltransferase
MAAFFRFMGQIPLRRGDDASTEWALAMAHEALASGSRIGIYPEGTRGPDPGTLYRLHQRVLVPLLRNDPDVPVHAITATYDRSGRRTRATVRVSPRLPLDASSQTDEEMTGIIRDELVRIGGLRYVDQYAFLAKARRERERERAALAAEEGAAGTEERPAG